MEKAQSYNDLGSEKKEAIGLLSIGTFLEYFDLMLYVHMAILLNQIFFPHTDPKTGALLSAFGRDRPHDQPAQLRGRAGVLRTLPRRRPRDRALLRERGGREIPVRPAGLRSDAAEGGGDRSRGVDAALHLCRPGAVLFLSPRHPSRRGGLRAASVGDSSLIRGKSGRLARIVAALARIGAASGQGAPRIRPNPPRPVPRIFGKPRKNCPCGCPVAPQKRPANLPRVEILALSLPESRGKFASSPRERAERNRKARKG